MHTPRWRAAAPAAVVLALLTAGCGGSRTLPTETGTRAGLTADPAFGSGFYETPAPSKDPGGAGLAGSYPLATGNRWDYRRTFKLRDAEGTAPPYDYEAWIECEQTCPVTIAGREYLTERHRETGPYIYLSWIRFRQTQRGLFEADLSILEPSCETLEAGEGVPTTDPLVAAAASWTGQERVVDAAHREALVRAHAALLEKLAWVHEATRLAGAGPARAFDPPGGPPEGELVRLRYPLIPGMSWVIRNEPRFEATVEAAETLDLPAGRLPGWRIRYDSALYGPRDRVLVWYGPQGFLKLHAYLESAALDSQGLRVGALVAEESQVLERYALVGSGGVAKATP